VTIAGQSSGGTAVSLLAVIPAARGLFERVIAESGDATFRAPRYSLDAQDQSGPLQTRHFAESVGEALLHELGAADIAAARALPVRAILKAVDGRGDLWTGPAIDGELLPAPNRSLYRSGRFNDTPILIGTNSDEGHGRTPPALKASELRDQTRAFTCPAQLFGVAAFGEPTEAV
jgi:para-nitrobenzyl esterase